MEDEMIMIKCYLRDDNCCMLNKKNFTINLSLIPIHELCNRPILTRLDFGKILFIVFIENFFVMVSLLPFIGE